MLDSLTIIAVTNDNFSNLPQLLVWPEQSPEDVTIVTITPDYPSSRHTGLVSGLKKFTWYYGSTLCFTTPGDGPRSPPTLVQTHEDSGYSHMHRHTRTRATAWIKPANNTKNSPVNNNKSALASSPFSPAVFISVIHSCVHNTQQTQYTCTHCFLSGS